MPLKTVTLDLDNLAADPAAPDDGTVWYNATEGALKAHIAGVTRVLTVDWNAQQMILVGKHGNDAASGDSWQEAKLTFTNAIATAVAALPTVTNQFAIVCLDAGIYTENISVPPFVHIFAPTAALVSAAATSTLIVAEDTEVTFREIEQNQAALGCIERTATVGRAHVNVDRITLTSGQVGVVSVSFAALDSVLIVKARTIRVIQPGGYGIGDVVNAGHMHVEVEEILLEGNNSTGIIRALAGETLVRCDHILEGGGAPVGTVGIECLSGNIDILVLDLQTDTAWNVAAGAVLSGFVASAPGIRNEAAGSTVNMVLAGTTAGKYAPGPTNPTTPLPGDGDLYYNTVLRMLMQYDGSRSKWLSTETQTIQFGRSASTPSGGYYRGVNGALLSPTVGWTAEFHGTIVSLEYTRADLDATAFQVMRGGVLAAAVASAANKGRDNALNANFAQDDVLAVRNLGNATTRVQGSFRVKWRVL